MTLKILYVRLVEVCISCFSLVVPHLNKLLTQHIKEFPGSFSWTAILFLRVTCSFMYDSKTFPGLHFVVVYILTEIKF